MEEVRNVHKRDIILTSIIILLPILLGIILWDRLPDRIATHFDADNVPNGWNSKVFTVFGIPCALLLMHILYFIILLNNSKKPNVSRKVSGLMMWIMPVISVVTNNIILLKAIGKDIDIGMIANLLCGILFIAVGNYLPKCRRNYLMGIRTPWTLANEDVWNKTHRLAGWCYLLIGICFLINAFYTFGIIILAVLVVCVILPCLYSFVLSNLGKQ